MIIYEIFHKSQVKKNEFWFSFVFLFSIRKNPQQKTEDLNQNSNLYIMKTYARIAYKNLLKNQGQNRNLIPVPIFKITTWKKSSVENWGFS